MHLTLPAEAASVPAARRAVSEACSNVVLHAYREHDEPGILLLEAEERDGMLEVVVADEGGSMHPREDSPGMGMGIALMAAVASGMQLDHDGAATRVHLTFDLGTASDEIPPIVGGEETADRD